MQLVVTFVVDGPHVEDEVRIAEFETHSAERVPREALGGQVVARVADAQTAASDPQAAVLRLLLQATTALARAGQADRACRLAATAWAALREPRPDLAATVTVALHGLTRHLGSVPAQVTAVSPGGDADLGVHDMPTARRRE